MQTIYFLKAYHLVMTMTETKTYKKTNTKKKTHRHRQRQIQSASKASTWWVFRKAKQIQTLRLPLCRNLTSRWWHWATYRADKQRGVGVQSKHQPVEQFSGIHLQQDLRSGISNIFDNYLVCAIWNNVFFIIIKYVLLLVILLNPLHNLLCGTSHKCI